MKNEEWLRDNTRCRVLPRVRPQPDFAAVLRRAVLHEVRPYNGPQLRKVLN